MFENIYYRKKVLVTGHTGFKGSWLVCWLLKLGAEVIGFSKDIPTNPSMFRELDLQSKITHYLKDVRDLSALIEVIKAERPDFVFHLAAQPIVSLSYLNPLETISSNVMGTANILEALRISNHKCTAIIITSDKAYDNIEQIWGYKENDFMGGKDIYSGSKGAAELIIKSYFNSFFNKDSCNVKLGIGRAGNVIGGGDWAKDRIVVDCMLAWSEGKSVEIRSPNSTRPWQHVLEPLSGYLKLGMTLYKNDTLNGESFNFGPKSEQNRTVQELIEDLSKLWAPMVTETFNITENIPFHEASLLKLNCDKALAYLKWQSSLQYQETIRFTGEWYFNFYRNNIDILEFTMNQIQEYEEIFKKNLF
ncbi:CDP-glucose 4,6-dehydratase [Polaribacter gangjinensis]|uniref:CDP-glucose 4,6-dehydratase n=1 Tax=Polaribacter gangjinensis TaxID=574710 RepID=A0A2S7W923_9FLAO|nr:CDP-glucose 4,6-dehydratase [Polaribacter gangjinensis]PQJ73791.1 CDP-glucose 4,6-dehydratase [Polaribacter gangjinensis]